MNFDNSKNSEFIVRNVLEPGLTTVFCGRAPSKESARQRAYYAYRSNKFWGILAEIGLTDRKLDPHEFVRLSTYGIGLTDINKTESGNDDELSGSGDDPKRVHIEIMEHQPSILAFNGKNNARMFFRHVFGNIGNFSIDYGVQPGVRIGKTEIHVLPNTSGKAAGYWDPGHWHNLAVRHRELMADK